MHQSFLMYFLHDHFLNHDLKKRKFRERIGYLNYYFNFSFHFSFAISHDPSRFHIVPTSTAFGQFKIFVNRET